MHVVCARQYHRERTGPEALGKPRRGVRNFAHPAMQEARTVKVHDHRMGHRPALGLKYLTHRGRALRIGAKSVNRFRRKSDEIAVAQCLHGGLDLHLTRSD